LLSDEFAAQLRDIKSILTFIRLIFKYNPQNFTALVYFVAFTSAIPFIL